MFSIYRITCSTNGKQYVGKTAQRIEHRFGKHLSKARNGTKTRFCSAIRKYGEEAFSVVLLETTETNEAASQIENFWIKFYLSNQLEHGYNLTEGGEGTFGYVRSEKDRKAVAEANRKRVWTPEARAKAAENCRKRTGEKRTPEACAHMVEAQHRPEVIAKHALRVGEKRAPGVGQRIAEGKRKAKLKRVLELEHRRSGEELL